LRAPLSRGYGRVKDYSLQTGDPLTVALPFLEMATDAVATPFVIVRPGLLPGLAGLPVEVREVDPLRPQNATFCLAMNRANCLAYDGIEPLRPAAEQLGMPRWVFLDCCALPSAIFGVEVARDHVPAELANLMDPEGECATLPVAEYIALPSLSPGEFVGISLFNLVRGQGFGRRVKALALAVLGARQQVGVAQFSNVSLRLHLAFGPLRLMQPSIRVHSRPDETFVYRVDVPDRQLLLDVWSGARRAVHVAEHDEQDVEVRLADIHAGRVDMSRFLDWSIVDTGTPELSSGILPSVFLRPPG
jgi:hypothetical protein